MLNRKLYNAGFIISSVILFSEASSIRTIAVRPETKLKTGMSLAVNGLCTCDPPDKKVTLRKEEIQLNRNVKSFVNTYINKNGFFLGKTKKRVAPLFAMMDSILIKNGLPSGLKYLAYIESGLQYNAISPVGAVGPWALMPVVAKQYGLKISKPKDERLDYYKSTHAAAALLNDLFDIYEDWLLVIAAYNCGPGRLDKAIRYSGTKHYWGLQNFLPKETRSHVKKFIAVHHFFEGKPGLVTMTREETEAYRTIAF